MLGLSPVSISKCLLIETGTYNDPQYRPFVSEYDAMSQSIFLDKVANVNRVTPQLLAGVAGQVIQPSAETYGNIAVPNGWDSRRFAFMIEVHTTNRAGHVSRQYITGWTDIPGATFSGAIAPDMRLFVNNVVRVTDNNTGFSMGPNGGMTTTVTETAHVITPPSSMMSAYGQMGGAPNIEMLTPHDVMTCMVANNAAFQFDQVYNLTTGVTTSTPRLSRRVNCLPSHYVSDTLNAVSRAMLTDESAMGTPMAATATDIYATAASALAENSVGVDPFFEFLRQRTSFSQFFSLQWSELKQIQPYLDSDQITMIIYKKDQLLRQVATRGDSEMWTSSASEAIIAYKLAYAIPAIMSALMVTEFACSATSLTETGLPTVSQVSRYDSFVKGINHQPLLQRLIDRIVTEIFPDITQGGQIPLSIIFDASLFEDIQITVHIAGRYPTPFRLPLFADAHYCPMVTTNGNVIRDIATSMEQMTALVGYNNAPTAHMNKPEGLQPLSFTDFAQQQQSWSNNNAHSNTAGTSRPSVSL